MSTEKTTHTPGPWTFKTDRITGDNGITAKGTGVFAETFADIREAGENRRHEALANARLIVAAPDLLEACEAAEFLLSALCVDRNSETRLRLREAIAKANGPTAADAFNDIRADLAAIAKSEG